MLNAGKHCACAVPMAADLDDLRRILAAQQASGKNDMMMETSTYSREFFFVQDLLARGEMGSLTFLRGTYHQDLEGGYAPYWRYWRFVRADNSLQYGPVCVAESFRGQGVLEGLIESIKTHYAPYFEFGITFIDARNSRSLAAHERKMGFRRLALLPFEAVTYHLLAFPCR